MVQYQSFPDAVGDSRTLEKLKALQLPVLEKKSFLDVGCNEGFFCGFARHAGASRVVGIDHGAEFIRRAQARFPDCEFLARGWDALPEGSFDVILLASALHYADDQAALIRQLVGRLTPEGVLVIELGIASSNKAEWITVKRGIDRRQFPTMPLLGELLADYAWKWVGPSVKQAGDPVPRHVIHISRRRPVAYLLMQPPASGKSSIARHLFVPAGIPVISGDAVLLEIAQGKRDVPVKLRKLVEARYSAIAADQTVRRIFDKGLGPVLVRTWLPGTNRQDIAIDSFVPEPFHEEVRREFEAAGYLPVTLGWKRSAHPLMSKQALSSLADGFYRSLGKAVPPPPATGDPARAAGYVDAISVTPSGITLRGWAIDENGAFPAQLVVGIGSERTILDTGAAQERKDVQRHLGWEHASLGYAVTLADAGIRSVAELGRQGFSVSLISGMPLRLSPAVKEALSGVAE
jgi:SAM-dependent methyltransferase